MAARIGIAISSLNAGGEAAFFDITQGYRIAVTFILSDCGTIIGRCVIVIMSGVEDNGCHVVLLIIGEGFAGADDDRCIPHAASWVASGSMNMHDAKRRGTGCAEVPAFSARPWIMCHTSNVTRTRYAVSNIDIASTKPVMTSEWRCSASPPGRAQAANTSIAIAGTAPAKMFSVWFGGLPGMKNAGMREMPMPECTQSRNTGQAGGHRGCMGAACKV